MENKIRFSEVLKKYTMVIVLALVIILFTVNTGGKMLLPQNVNNLIVQNAYVFILATGMLFCILTGGNIDLSVGSVVCFVGAVGGKMMVTNEMNPYLSIIVMLLVGLLIGAWQGFWIAYVRIPPFIVTLAGMLVFRGLSNVVLEGMTLAPMPDNFLALFNNYIPDFFGMEGFNMTCFLVGVVVCVLYVFMVLKGRASRAKKGYRVEPFGGVLIKNDRDLCSSSGIYVPSGTVQRYSELSGMDCPCNCSLYLHCFKDYSGSLFLCSRRQRESNKAFRYQYKQSLFPGLSEHGIPGSSCRYGHNSPSELCQPYSRNKL